MRVLFCAYREWAYDVFRELLKQKTRDYTLVSTPESLDRLTQKENYDVVVVVGWSWKIPTNVIESNLVIGMHPSDLPKFSGGSPIQNQIMSGLTETNATLFRLSEKFDEGNLIDKEKFSLDGHLDDVFTSISAATLKLLVRFFDKYPNNVYVKQNDLLRTKFKRLTPSDSRLSSVERQPGHKLTAREFWNFIRCHEYPYPNVYLEDDTGIVSITSAEFKEPKR